MTKLSVELRAESLFSKWGFGDGDMLDDILEANGFDQEPRRDDDHLYFDHEVLALCVERYLLPELPEPVATFRVGTIHNPIRAETVKKWEAEIPPALLGFGVEISADTVLAVAREVRAARSA